MLPTLPGTSSVAQAHALSLAELGALVRSQRKAQGIRIDDAAALCGVSTGVLSRMENGQPVGTDKLMRVLNGLGLTLFALSKSDALKVKRTLTDTVSQES
ncbi:helix-turn-helix domain-containing protein [Massilia sp. SR12]